MTDLFISPIRIGLEAAGSVADLQEQEVGWLAYRPRRRRGEEARRLAPRRRRAAAASRAAAPPRRCRARPAEPAMASSSRERSRAGSRVVSLWGCLPRGTADFIARGPQVQGELDPSRTASGLTELLSLCLPRSAQATRLV